MVEILKSLAQEGHGSVLIILGLVWQARLWHKQFLKHKVELAKLNKK